MISSTVLAEIFSAKASGPMVSMAWKIGAFYDGFHVLYRVPAQRRLVGIGERIGVEFRFLPQPPCVGGISAQFLRPEGFRQAEIAGGIGMLPLLSIE